MRRVSARMLSVRVPNRTRNVPSRNTVVYVVMVSGLRGTTGAVIFSSLDVRSGHAPARGRRRRPAAHALRGVAAVRAGWPPAPARRPGPARAVRAVAAGLRAAAGGDGSRRGGGAAHRAIRCRLRGPAARRDAADAG